MSEKQKAFNLINIKIKNNNCAEIELLYKADIISEDIKIYLESEKGKTYLPKKQSPIIQDAIKRVRVVFKLEITDLGELKLKLEENKKKYDTILLDNKDETIFEFPNKYNIFTPKYVLSINPKNGSFTIKKRRLGEKFIYELNKQIYAIKKYHHLYLIRLLKGREKYYLFNDKLMYGDDNAEQLFIHINNQHKEMAKRCYYVLDKKSDRINQIKKVGKVVFYGSLKHKFMYLNAKMILSSHASYYDKIYNPFDEKEMDIYKDVICKNFIFLQHGVIGNDLHEILNRCNILADIFITTTSKEYEDLKTERYLYDEDMIKCTGLARFDRLINERKNVILISPTWRAYLTQAEYTNDKGNEFEKSQFYKGYQSLLQNEQLLRELRNYKYKIKFLLHPVFAKYKELFMELSNDCVEILSNQDIKYSDMFKECSMLITDYSSIHFDVAFLQKPIIYYQFDKEKFFESHYSKGYYDYEKDGFGDVIENEDMLIKKIKCYLENNCEIEEKYKKVIQNTFKYLDRNNSERIYQEMLKLDNIPEKVYRFNNVS